MKTDRPLWLPILVIWALLTVGPLAGLLPILIENPWQLVQDDGRHFVSWLRTLENPALFPSDPIARFFTAITPQVYKALFWPAVAAGIDVVHWHIVVLIPGIMLLTIFSLDRFVALFEADRRLRLAILLAFVGFSYGSFDNGLPRDFAPFIVSMSIVAYLKNRQWLLGILMLFGASMYPAAAITVGVGLGVFEVIRILAGRHDIRHIVTISLAALCGAAGLALFQTGVGDLGPTMSLAEARELPIFQSGGRTSYFEDDSTWEMMTCGRRAGVFASCPPGQFWWLAYPLHFIAIAGGLFVLARRGYGDYRILFSLCLAGLILFAAASAVAFEMHLPARYAMWSIQFATTFLLIVWIVSGIERIVARMNAPTFFLPLVCGLVFLAKEPEKFYTFDDLIHDPIPRISAALRQTPVDTTVAGLSKHIDNVPSFSGRSVWASLQLSVPYKKNYYFEMADRVSLLSALFEETDSETWQGIHVASGINMYLLSQVGQIDKWKNSFSSTPAGNKSSIFEVFPTQTKACTVAEQHRIILLDGTCFADAISAL